MGRLIAFCFLVGCLRDERELHWERYRRAHMTPQEKCHEKVGADDACRAAAMTNNVNLAYRCHAQHNECDGLPPPRAQYTNCWRDNNGHLNCMTY